MHFPKKYSYEALKPLRFLIFSYPTLWSGEQPQFRVPGLQPYGSLASNVSSTDRTRQLSGELMEMIVRKN